MAVTWLVRMRERTLALWRRLRDERATPREIGWAVATGAFVGCTPALGFHTAVAVAAATLFRLNKLWTWLGSRVSNIFILPWIVLAEVELGHHLRTGSWTPLTASTALSQGHVLLLDWMIGLFPVGGLIAACLGPLAYAVARYRAARKREAADRPG